MVFLCHPDPASSSEREECRCTKAGASRSINQKKDRPASQFAAVKSRMLTYL